MQGLFLYPQKCVEMRQWCCPGTLSCTVCAAKPRWGYLPDFMTVEAVILAKVTLLQALSAALRANAPSVNPISIAVQTILNMVFIDRNAKVIGQFFSFLPGHNLQFEQLKVRSVRTVVKKCVASFMQQ